MWKQLDGRRISRTEKSSSISSSSSLLPLLFLLHLPSLILLIVLSPQFFCFFRVVFFFTLLSFLNLELVSSLDWNPTWNWFRAGIVGSSAFLCFLWIAGRKERRILCFFSLLSYKKLARYDLSQNPTMVILAGLRPAAN